MPAAASPPASTLEFDSPLCPATVAAVATADRAVVVDDVEGGVFYGWLMVLVTTIVLVASSPGQTFGFTYFNPWLRRSLALSQTELSATYLFATLLAAIPLAYVGGVVDRVGLKRSMLAAIAAMSGACLLAAVVQNVAMLFAACVAMRLVGPGVMTLLANNTLAAWFDHRLGLASSAMQLGMAAAFGLVPVGIMTLIASVGWREAYALLGLALCVGVLPLVWWTYHEHPRDVGQVRDGRAGSLRTLRTLAMQDEETCFTLREASRTRAFWIIVIATCAWSMVGTGLVFHLDSLLASRGLSDRQIGWATPVMAICMAAMQLVAGRLADRVAAGRLAAAALVLVASACVAFAVARGGALIAAYGIYGLGQGIMSLVGTTVWARYYGREHLGRIRGTALTAAISASAVGPLVMGASVDFLGGFEPAMWAFAAGAIIVALACPLATPPVKYDAHVEFTLPNAA